ncbi:SCO6880 family protein [Kineococcus terrestris]|uniref:SCO6880 family protein n=1 Tax=Kineococcus terrestris TaxID=2044856 RepID=UPI0034DB4BC8
MSATSTAAGARPGSAARDAGTFRTYGGWRRTRGIGLFGLGATATVVVVVAALVPLVALGTSPRTGLLLCVPSAVVVALTCARVDGTPVLHALQRRAQWAWASWRGYTSLRGGVLVEHPCAWQLPGALAPTKLLSCEDGRGGRFGLVHDTRSGNLTATLRCAATSTWLVDGADADGWVANWHAWLASRGFDPMVQWVAVTVDTAPEPGSTLARNVAQRLDPHAPPDTLDLLHQLVETSPAASADVETRVSITFAPARAGVQLRDAADAAAEVSRALAGMEAALAECGVTVLGRARADELAGAVRVAFDPASRGDVESALDRDDGRGESLTWEAAGPVAAEEAWDHYRHDSGTSVSWAWHEAPRQQVTSNVLVRLMSPSRYPKRVTMLYRPMSAGAAARLLEDQVNAAAFREAYRRTQGRDATARDQADQERAVSAAREEALGAGVVLMSLYTTITVTDPADLSAAVADLESRADQSKVRVRRLYGAQAVGFATTLPAGIYPPHVAGRVLR